MKPEDKKILHLTLKREWFDLILSGEKTEEYREYKPYWIKRLMGHCGRMKQFDIVRFRNGYRKEDPIMDVKFEGTFLRRDKGDYFAIKLGKVLSYHNI